PLVALVGQLFGLVLHIVNLFFILSYRFIGLHRCRYFSAGNQGIDLGKSLVVIVFLFLDNGYPLLLFGNGDDLLQILNPLAGVLMLLIPFCMVLFNLSPVGYIQKNILLEAAHADNIGAQPGSML